ncbi:hypothetical protein [Methylomonas sp. MgM2]
MSNSKRLSAFITMQFFLTAAFAVETNQISFDALPEAVKTSALQIIDKDAISKITQINENNLIRFDIEADKTENNKEVTSWDVIVASNGKVMRITKQVPYYTLSYPQMQEIEKRYPGIKVTEVESVDIHYFDVVGEVNGKPANFRLYEDGLIENQSNP